MTATALWRAGWLVQTGTSTRWGACNAKPTVHILCVRRCLGLVMGAIATCPVRAIRPELPTRYGAAGSFNGRGVP